MVRIILNVLYEDKNLRAIFDRDANQARYLFIGTVTSLSASYTGI